MHRTLQFYCILLLKWRQNQHFRLRPQTSWLVNPWEECHVLVGNRPQRWPVTKKNTAFFPQIYKSPCPTCSLDHLNKVYCLIGRVPVRGSRCITKLQSGYKLRCCWEKVKYFWKCKFMGQECRNKRRAKKSQTLKVSVMPRSKLFLESSKNNFALLPLVPTKMM